MLTAVKEPLEVKLVHEGGLLELLGPALIAAAAVVAAAVAAYTANKRHAAQLLHDRELRDREEVGKVVDSAIDAANGALKAWSRFGGQVESAERARSAEEPAQAQTRAVRSALGESYQQAYSLITEMMGNTLRLAVRLGEDHAVTESCDEMARGYLDLGKSLEGAIRSNRTDDLKAREKELNRKASDLHEKFLKACRNWLLRDA